MRTMIAVIIITRKTVPTDNPKTTVVDAVFFELFVSTKVQQKSLIPIYFLPNPLNSMFNVQTFLILITWQKSTLSLSKTLIKCTVIPREIASHSSSSCVVSEHSITFCWSVLQRLKTYSSSFPSPFIQDEEQVLFFHCFGQLGLDPWPTSQT